MLTEARRALHRIRLLVLACIHGWPRDVVKLTGRRLDGGANVEAEVMYCDRCGSLFLVGAPGGVHVVSQKTTERCPIVEFYREFSRADLPIAKVRP